MAKFDKSSFFSVAPDLIACDRRLAYDLYINAAGQGVNENFVRIFPREEVLERSDLTEMTLKYQNFYVLEAQRSAYLASLIKSDEFNDLTKTSVIKESAIKHLDDLFSGDKKLSTELLAQSIEACRDSVAGMLSVIKDYRISRIQGLIANLSFHDFYTYDHSVNVSMYAIALLRKVKKSASDRELTEIGLGGLLHDLGKIKIPTHIINRPGRLSEAEYRIIKKHPDMGKALISEQKREFTVEGVDFRVIERIIHEHHENYNGSGYPSGLSEEKIHLYARITAIADFFDAITTKRSYHAPLSTEDALCVMEKSAGKKIDPELFRIFSTDLHQLVSGAPRPSLELPADFDPCQPHDCLPFERKKTEVLKSDIFNEKARKNGKNS